MELMMQDEFDRAILYPGAWTTKIVTAYAAALARIATLETERDAFRQECRDHQRHIAALKMDIETIRRGK